MAGVSGPSISSFYDAWKQAAPWDFLRVTPSLQITSTNKCAAACYSLIKGLRGRSQDMVDLSLLLMADHMVLAGRVVTLASTREDVLENDNVCEFLCQSILCWQSLHPSVCFLWFGLTYFSILWVHILSKTLERDFHFFCLASDEILLQNLKPY